MTPLLLTFDLSRGAGHPDVLDPAGVDVVGPGDGVPCPVQERGGVGRGETQPTGIMMSFKCWRGEGAMLYVLAG